MSSEPLTRSDLWVGVPNEADYDAAYAAVAATERGRWFLTEYAARNGCTAADRRMEQDPARAPDISAAVDRLADIAFELRERAADAALCDALEAAVREISVAYSPPAGVPEPEIDCCAGAAAAPAALEPSFVPPSAKSEAFSQAPDISSVADVTARDFEAADKAPSSDRMETSRRSIIPAPDFVFQPPQRQTNGHDAGGTEQTHALLPRLEPADPHDDPAELFEPAQDVLRMDSMPTNDSASSHAAPSPTSSRTFSVPPRRPASCPAP